ncbi:MAG TPA: flagellar hook-associated protein FlgK [Brevundimonas sp.]|uniref:flagellar hook-associated protein FlgK n=1 Tax=Brevundimonas sp. TaxID=1871086 RepID=UPI002E10DEFF|nr:flagellar hook-associated protein FlgK [Brevundimonas sp.]
MSLNLIMNTSTSGLMTAQTQLRVVSDNVANVNTPGYVRKIADQVAMTSQGIGSGVDVVRVRLATDRFLQAAAMSASSEEARQGVRYELYDRVQSLFGDPGGTSGFFAQVDDVFSAFTSLAEEPTSTPRRQDALYKAQAVFDEASRISTQIQSVRADADSRIRSGVEQVNDLLSQIEALNDEIARSKATASDASGAESAQAALLGELGKLMDIRTSVRDLGGVTVRSGSGTLLAGRGHAVLEYGYSGEVQAETIFGDIFITEPRGAKRSLMDDLTSGELRGLVEVRDTEAPAAAERLAELMTRVADELNRAHNANSAAPPPNSLTGRNVGQTFDTAIAGFTGNSSVVVTNAAGIVQARADIVFSGGTMTVNGAGATPATFLATLNAQLGGTATASFANGVLSLQATAAANGVAVIDDPAAPSSKTGRGFSHFFGLNDLVTSSAPALYETGMTAASQHGFAAGQTLSFRFYASHGGVMRDIQVTVPPGGDMASLLAQLNSPVNGVGRFGSFTLDANGAMTFANVTGGDWRMAVASDQTEQTPSGVSLSTLFGIGGGTRASRADSFSLRTDVQRNPALLALGQVDHAAAVGGLAITPGDGRGAQRLSLAGQNNVRFEAAGGGIGGVLSVSRYASELSGEIGGLAATMKRQKDAAASVSAEAKARQVAQEGVNLDEELVLLTTYQQAFNASARMIQAAREMYDALLGMV